MPIYRDGEDQFGLVSAAHDAPRDKRDPIEEKSYDAAYSMRDISKIDHPISGDALARGTANSPAHHSKDYLQGYFNEGEKAAGRKITAAGANKGKPEKIMKLAAKIRDAKKR